MDAIARIIVQFYSLIDSWTPSCSTVQSLCVVCVSVMYLLGI